MMTTPLTWLTVFLAVLLASKPVPTSPTAAIGEGVAAVAFLHRGVDKVACQNN